jgi:AraC family transcriptional regulator
MRGTAASSGIGAETPLLDIVQIASRTPGKADLRALRYRTARPHHGLAITQASAETHVAGIHLWAFGARDQWRDDRHAARAVVGAGAVGIQDFRRSWVTGLPDPFHMVDFEIPRWKLDEVVDELSSGRIDGLRCADNTHDDVMLHLALALLPTLARPWEANALFVDYVLNAVSIHLVRTYGDLRARPPHLVGTLARWQERRAIELLTAAVEADIGLADLARACELSVGHFSRAFKRSMGMTPHRWLLGARVGRAKHLLEHTSAALSEIALNCGFADQSHFTRTFSRLVGCSPGAWRRERR